MKDVKSVTIRMDERPDRAFLWTVYAIVECGIPTERHVIPSEPVLVEGSRLAEAVADLMAQIKL